jgi:hypothetical protein
MGDSDTPPASRPPTRDGAEREEDGENLTAVDGFPVWVSSLSRRGKLRRGGLTALLVSLVAFLLLGGPNALFTHVSGSIHVASVPWAALQPSPATQPRVAASVALSQVRLPPGTARTSSLHVSPSNTANGSAYACWVSSDAQVHGGGIGALHFATLGAPSGQWATHGAPTPEGNSCFVASDSAAPARVLFAVWPSAAASSNCGLPILYVSADDGRTWRQAPWPDGNMPACLNSLAFMGGQIYALADTSLLPATQSHGAAQGRFIATNDLGAHWRAVDSGFNNPATFYVVGIRPGGHLLVQATSADGQTSQLYLSDDDGASWRALGSLPGVAPEVYASSDPSDTTHGGFGRLYLIGRQPTGSASGEGGAPYYASAYVGSAWTTFDAPPITRALGGPTDTPILTADVGPGDSLVLTLATALDTSGAPAANPALWSWDPSATTWTLQPYDIPLNSALQGHSWSNGHMMAWLLITSSGAPQAAEIQTYVLPVGTTGA